MSTTTEVNGKGKTRLQAGAKARTQVCKRPQTGGRMELNNETCDKELYRSF